MLSPAARDANGWTPLMVAATHGHLAMCQMLVELEADIHARKNFKCTALHLAARGGHTSVVEFLVQCKADVMAEKIDKSTALHDAVAGGYVEVAKILLGHMEGLHERSAILKLANDHGRTPLHVASKRGHPDMVCWLLARGAVTTLRDEDQKTAIELSPNRRTLVAFPGHIDPVDVSAQQVGVMQLELEEMNLLKLDSKGKLLSPASSPDKRGTTRRVRRRASLRDRVVVSRCMDAVLLSMTVRVTILPRRNRGAVEE